MLTIDVIYAPTTRQISLPRKSDFYGGATIDSNSVEISVTGIDATKFTSDLHVRIDFAVYILVEGNKSIRPFIILELKDGEWKGTIPTEVLRAAAKTRKLPFQLVLRDGNVTINSRNTLTMEVTRAIDAMETVQETYGPYIMLRDDTWSWLENFTYKKGSIVSYEGNMYVSLVDQNLGNIPPGQWESSEYWKLNVGLQGPQGPPGEKVSAGDMVIRYIGDGHSLEYDVPHNLGTTKVIYGVQKNGVFVYPTVSVRDENSLHVKFTSPPGMNEVIMSIYSGGIITEGAYVYEQTIESARWDIIHNLHKNVDVTVLDETGTLINAHITHPSLDEVTVLFNQSVAGKAIIR